MSVFWDSLRQKSQLLLCWLEATAQNEIYFEMKNKLLSGQKFIVSPKAVAFITEILNSWPHLEATFWTRRFEKQTTTLWHTTKNKYFIPNILYV